MLPQRFANHPRLLFIVAETIFGTGLGLNFLAMCQDFADFHQALPDARHQRLHFISFEKFLLRQADLAAAHGCWPQLAPYAEELRAKSYAPNGLCPLPGCHHLLLATGRITPDLWFSNINTLLAHVDASIDNQVDTWFLDGFAPSKNPDIWADQLFSAMVSFARPEGGFATFTAAGFMRRGLQQTGFWVSRYEDFGQKREMLAVERTVTLAMAVDRLGCIRCC